MSINVNYSLFLPTVFVAMDSTWSRPVEPRHHSIDQTLCSPHHGGFKMFQAHPVQTSESSESSDAVCVFQSHPFFIDIAETNTSENHSMLRSLMNRIFGPQ